MKIQKHTIFGYSLLGLFLIAGVFYFYDFNLSGTFKTQEYVLDVSVMGDYAYLANMDDGFRILNISQPSEITEISHIVDYQRILSVQVVREYAYLAAGYQGFIVLDISNPANPVEVASLSDGNYTSYVNVVDNYAFVICKGFKIIDISDPTDPILIQYVTSSEIDHLAEYLSIAELQIVDNNAYLVCGKDGLIIYDISNKNLPVELGRCNDNYNASEYSSGYATAIQVVGDYAYIADNDDGLEIIDISDPTAPFEVGQFQYGGYTKGVYIHENYAYLADSKTGLEIVDISDPTNPSSVLSVHKRGQATDVFVVGDYAYLAGQGLSIYRPWGLGEPISKIIIRSLIGICGILWIVMSIKFKFQQRRQSQQQKKFRDSTSPFISNTRREDPLNLQKLQQMIKVSKKIRLDMMQDALNMSKSQFNSEIFNWAERYHFQIDGDYLIINPNTVDAFMTSLDSLFNEWTQNENLKN